MQGDRKLNIKLFFILIISALFIISPLSNVLSITTSSLNENLIKTDFKFLSSNTIIKPFSEINCGPAPIYYVENGVDLTTQYQEIGIDFIRTHDFFGPTDISMIFPDWSADPTEESSYDFLESDKIINAIVNSGSKVFYRLGESASNNESLRTPPKDFNKWAEICKHIVMHYNDGWNDGYYHDIQYWEIWNEPDLVGFWNGTCDQYFQLYHITVEKLKDYDSALKIGGPCTSSVYDQNYTTGFLEYITSNDIPLDFYSWHMYADRPYDLFTASKKVRHMLDEFGLFECENINTEWNINILTPQRDKENAKNAAFTACVLSAFQDCGMDYAFRYRGTQDFNWLMRLIGFDLSLFSYEGEYKTPALSYLAMNYFIKDTPNRIESDPIDALSGVTFLGGYSDDISNVTFLISNFDLPDSILTLEFENLPWESYTFNHYLIDDSHHFEKINEIDLTNSNFSFNLTLEKESVHFIRFTNSTILPDKGSEVVDIPFILRLKILDPFTQLLGFLILSLIFG